MQARKDVLLTMKNEEICSNPDEYNRLTILDTNAERFSEFKYVIIMLGMDGIKCENFYLSARGRLHQEPTCCFLSAVLRETQHWMSEQQAEQARQQADKSQRGSREPTPRPQEKSKKESRARSMLDLRLGLSSLQRAHQRSWGPMLMDDSFIFFLRAHFIFGCLQCVANWTNFSICVKFYALQVGNGMLGMWMTNEWLHECME
jgi:hypothetical protein